MGSEPVSEASDWGGVYAESAPVLGLAMVLALLLDLGWVASCRMATRWASSGRLWPDVLVIGIGIAMAVVGVPLLPLVGSQVTRPSEVLLVFVSSTRLFISAVALVHLAVLLLAVAHRVVWPLLSRIVYAAERHKFFKERKLFGSLGTALMIHAGGGAWLKSVAAALGLPT